MLRQILVDHHLRRPSFKAPSTLVKYDVEQIAVWPNLHLLIEFTWLVYPIERKMRVIHEGSLIRALTNTPFIVDYKQGVSARHNLASYRRRAVRRLRQ